MIFFSLSCLVDFTIREILTDPEEAQQFMQNMSIAPAMAEGLLNTTVNSREVGSLLMNFLDVHMHCTTGKGGGCVVGSHWTLGSRPGQVILLCSWRARHSALAVPLSICFCLNG